MVYEFFEKIFVYKHWFLKYLNALKAKKTLCLTRRYSSLIDALLTMGSPQKTCDFSVDLPAH